MSAADQINAIREKWHTKSHPFFRAMAEGKLELRGLGVYMANHFKFVEMVQPSFGLLFYRAPEDIQVALIENLAEEQGLAAIPKEGHVPHNHYEMIFRFCAAAGLSQDEVYNTQLPPAWWARSLHYIHCMRDEPLGVALAMQSTQEGQQVALNHEVTIPAFQKHYGFERTDPEIDFFVEHAEADLEHSARQMALCERHLKGPEALTRALVVCEDACRLRWASITEIYREHHLKEHEILPVGIAA